MSSEFGYAILSLLAAVLLAQGGTLWGMWGILRGCQARYDLCHKRMTDIEARRLVP